ncbi:nucleotide exchange factor GrpE [Kiritimatiellota bacterium B12222]|nr:nucleotide exchange factor GrpE [Kiritimatiellota bacterium B12222]
MTEKSENEEILESKVEETPLGEEAVTETQTEAADTTEAAEEVVEVPPAAKEDVQTEQEDFKDLYLRLRADFENFRKRTRREKEEWTQRCVENLCTDLLTVMDHFDLGIDNSKGKEFTEESLKGFELVRGQLSNTLGKYGLSVVDATEGNFDPNIHEAITHMPSADVEEGKIVAQTRKGYKMGDRLLRPAQVVVSAGAPATEAEGEA